MKIAVFHNLPSGGALRALYEKIKLFEEQGHRVSLFVFSTAEKDFLPAPSISGTYSVTALDFSGPLKYLRYLKASTECAAQINASDAEFVYVDKCRYLGSPSILQFLKKTSTLYLHEPLGVREYTDQAPQSDASFSAFAQDYLKLSFSTKAQKVFSIPVRIWIKDQDRKNVRSASRVLTCSQFAKDWVDRVYGIDAQVAYQGVNVNFFTPQVNVEKRNQVLSVGRIEPRKGHDFIIKVLAEIETTVRPSLVVVYDEASEAAKRELEAQACLLGVSLELVFRPEQDRLKKLYQESQLVLCAGVNEPFGLVPLEAAACGTAVIAVNEGGYKETVVEDVTGWLLPRHAAVWAQKIITLINNPMELKRVGGLSRSFVEMKWTWHGFLDRLKK